MQPANLGRAGSPDGQQLLGRVGVAERTAQPAQILLGRRAARGSAGAGTAGCGARASAGTGTRARSPCRRRDRRSRRRSAARSASSVARRRSRSSARPCTSCSSCTENSTSRSPPSPSLSSRPASRAGMCATTRLRIAWDVGDEVLPFGRTSRPSAPPCRRRPGPARGRRRSAAPSAWPGTPRSWPTSGSRSGGWPGSGRAGRICPPAAGRVDLPDRAGLGVSRTDPGQLGGHPGGRGDGGVGGEQRLALVVQRRFGHEQHVDVGDVVEFLGAALAQRRPRPAGCCSALSPTLARPMARAASRVASARSESSSATCGIASIGSGCTEVTRSDPQDHRAVGQPQAVPDEVGGHRQRGLRVGSHRLQQPSPQFGGGPLGQAVVEHVEVGGVGDEVLSESGAGTENENEVAGEVRRRLEPVRTGSGPRRPGDRGWSGQDQDRPPR